MSAWTNSVASLRHPVWYRGPSQHGARWVTHLGAILAAVVTLSCGNRQPPLRFTVTVPSTARAEVLTGRVFVVLSRDSAPEPRLAMGNLTQTPPFFGVDVTGLPAGQAAVIDDTTLGYPVSSLRGIPAGDYYAQAVVNVYTEFHRSDGHTIWAHNDQWEGQHMTRSPGNLVSEVTRVHLDPAAGYAIALQATRVLPAVVVPPDTKWVKRVKIQSAMLTKFWGQPIYFGATILLPAGYDEHPNARYPVLYEQGHFTLNPPFGFTTDSGPTAPAVEARQRNYNLESGYAFYKEWSGPHFPRMIVVTFQHPTPYYDDSYAVNSVNNGPYGDALIQELIPYVESHFRIIAKPYARVLSGGSTGGWESLALQLYHPDFFGGTWTLYPDMIDFSHYQLVNAYADTNAFLMTTPVPGGPVTDWVHPERYIMRGNDDQPYLTAHQQSQIEDVAGSHGRSAEQLEIWEAVFGPIGADGYPVALWDKRTGHINHDVALYMRDHGYDLRAYLQQHWAEVGPKLVGKIHIDVGDNDNYYLNLPVYAMQQFFDSTKSPHVDAVFRYGRPLKGHGWEHASQATLLREMAAAIRAHAPSGENVAAWMY
jgi:hypothetical protein